MGNTRLSRPAAGFATWPLIWLLAAGLPMVLAGCASSGATGPLPLVTDPLKASNVTIYRNNSWVGLFGTIRVRIEGEDLVRLGRNESYSFRLDPGEYLFDWSIGLNSCRRVILIRDGREYRIRLVPNCMLVQE